MEVKTLKAVFKAIVPKTTVPSDFFLVELFYDSLYAESIDSLYLIFPINSEKEKNNLRECIIDDTENLTEYQIFALYIFNMFDTEKDLFSLMKVEKIIKVKISFTLLNHEDILKRNGLERRAIENIRKKELNLF